MTNNLSQYICFDKDFKEYANYLDVHKMYLWQNNGS